MKDKYLYNKICKIIDMLNEIDDSDLCLVDRKLFSDAEDYLFDVRLLLDEDTAARVNRMLKVLKEEE